jgi:hypothetical protein
MSSKHPRRPVDLEGMLLQTQPTLRPFENRTPLYVMHFFFAFVSRMWDMGLVLLIAQITNNSLFLVAITGLCSALSVFLFMGGIGHYLDKTNRIVAVRVALFSKVLFVTLAYLVCAYLCADADAAAAERSLSLRERQTMLYSIPVLGALAGLSFCGITQSIEKDWIVVLSAKDSVWLSATNSVMTQIDLGCSSLAPLVTGILFAQLPHSVVAIILLFINAVSSVALYIYMSYLYHAWPALGHKVGVDVLEAAEEILKAESAELEYCSDDDEQYPLTQPPNYGATATSGAGNSNKRTDSAWAADGKSRLSVRSAAELTAKQSRRMSADALQMNKSTEARAETGVADDTPCCGHFSCAVCGGTTIGGVFKDFLQSGCAGMMVSYAFLYLTVLSFGSLMTVYVRWAGVSDDRLGLFRGLAALFGYSGAVLFPYISGWLGLWAAAQVAILYQFVLVAVAASSVFWEEASASVYVVIVAVVRGASESLVQSKTVSFISLLRVLCSCYQGRDCGCSTSVCGKSPRKPSRRQCAVSNGITCRVAAWCGQSHFRHCMWHALSLNISTCAPHPRRQGEWPVALYDCVLRDGRLRSGGLRPR